VSCIFISNQSVPSVWNALPQTVLISDYLSVFKFRLRTCYSLGLSLNMIRPAASASEVATVFDYKFDHHYYYY